MKFTRIFILFVVISFLLPQGTINSQTKFKKWQKQDKSNPCKFDELYNSLSTLYERGLRDEAASPDFLKTIKSILNRYAPSPIFPTEGLVAYFPFNGNANDESGNGNNGTNNGAMPTTDRFGNVEKAYSFDGSSSYITIVDPNNKLNFDATTEDYSVSVWVKLASLGGSPGQNIFSDRSGIDNSPTSSEIAFNISINTFSTGIWDRSLTSVIQSETKATLEQWYHIVQVVKARKHRLYINGHKEVNYQISASPDVLPANFKSTKNNNGARTIGKRGVEAKDYFNGVIDDIRIYNRALTESEIQALYHEGGW